MPGCCCTSVYVPAGDFHVAEPACSGRSTSVIIISTRSRPGMRGRSHPIQALPAKKGWRGRFAWMPRYRRRRATARHAFHRDLDVAGSAAPPSPANASATRITFPRGTTPRRLAPTQTLSALSGRTHTSASMPASDPVGLAPSAGEPLQSIGMETSATVNAHASQDT